MILSIYDWKNWFLDASASISLWTNPEHPKGGKHESSIISGNFQELYHFGLVDEQRNILHSQKKN